MNTFQGDVDIRQIDKIPPTAKLIDTQIVMSGEQTGHHHQFTSGQVLIYEPTKSDTITIRENEKVPVVKYIHVLQDAVLTHPEHAPQTIPAGTYVILQEREYDVLTQQIRPIID